jgi:hypothetical protein
MLFPRLRSTKSSAGVWFRGAITADYLTRCPSFAGLGRRAGRDSDYVLHLIGRDAEIGRDLLDGISSLESIYKVLDPSSVVDDQRQSKCDLWVDHHLSVGVGRQAHRVSPAVAPVVDPLQVAPDDLGELALLGADDHQLPNLAFPVLVRIVEEHLGTVGVEAFRGKRVLDANLLSEDLDCWSDPLEWYARPSEARQDERLRKANERDGRLTPMRPEAGNQRMPGLWWTSPSLDVRLRDVQIGSRLAQREDGAGDPGIVSTYRRLLLCGLLDRNLSFLDR